jgi:hypothetical protein
MRLVRVETWGYQMQVRQTGWDDLCRAEPLSAYAIT